MAWSGIRGQDVAVRMLEAHIAQQRLAAAYLLAGPEGVGKKPVAREYAKALNCQAASARPCDVCPPCGQIQRGTHPDVHWLLPEGASKQIKIEQVRHVIGRLSLRPFSARCQVAVIDGAERMTDEAANSLLKILEEPPQHSRFMLLTSRVSDCLPTIVSRCQLIRCRPLPAALLQALLVEQGADSRAAMEVAPLAAGSITRALALLERWQARQTLRNQLASEVPAAWYAERLPETREEAAELLEEMTAWLRDLALTRVGAVSATLVHASYQAALARQAQRVDSEQCLELLHAVLALRDSIEEQYVSPRLVGMVARERWLSTIAPRPHGG